MTPIKRYKMGSCGIVYSMDLKLYEHKNGTKTQLLQGWDLVSEKEAKARLIDKLYSMKTECENAIKDLENNNTTHKKG